MISATRKRRDVPNGIRGKMLMQVVRSFLHFSQLSAWLAVSKGDEPRHILYRVTMPGENFGSKFSRIAEDHEFPVATFKNHLVNVRNLKYCVLWQRKMTALMNSMTLF